MLLRRKYQDLLRNHLDKLLDKLFTEFTGIHYRIAWKLPLAASTEARALPASCFVCCRLAGAGPRVSADCRKCGIHNLAAALRLERGHRFTCHLGIRTYWLPIRIQGEALGIACLQAMDRYFLASRKHVHRETARALGQLQFARAARFLHFIIRLVQSSSLADLHQADLRSARQAVVALEREQARLHEILQRHLPSPAQVSSRPTLESHAEQIAQRLLRRIELDYSKPLTLKQLAAELRLNAAYVSSLFSRAVGMPFKTALTEQRIDKAKQLLTDPKIDVLQVANAAGYASADRFRIAFKKATGLSPKMWRETMLASTPPPETYWI
jgi:AraC-like DNA-binding protein